MTCRRSIILLNKHNAENKFLPLNNYGGQRPLSDAWVRELVKKVEDGRFGAAQIATCRFGEENYLINGQHCVHMAMLADCERPSAANPPAPTTARTARSAQDRALMVIGVGREDSVMHGP